MSCHICVEGWGSCIWSFFIFIDYGINFAQVTPGTRLFWRWWWTSYRNWRWPILILYTVSSLTFKENFTQHCVQLSRDSLCSNLESCTLLSYLQCVTLSWVIMVQWWAFCACLLLCPLLLWSHWRSFISSVLVMFCSFDRRVCLSLRSGLHVHVIEIVGWRENKNRDVGRNEMHDHSCSMLEDHVFFTAARLHLVQNLLLCQLGDLFRRTHVFMTHTVHNACVCAWYKH